MEEFPAFYCGIRVDRLKFHFRKIFLLHRMESLTIASPSKVRWTMAQFVRNTLFLGLLVLVISFSGIGAAQQPAVKIDWQRGPTVGLLGDIAEIKVPEGYLFAGKDGAQKVLQLTHNIPSGQELGVVVPAGNGSNWFMIFEFEDTGYIKDDDKDKLDANAILKNIQEATEAGNETRQSKGWSRLHVSGWENPPHYDPLTHNVTWALRVKGDNSNDAGDVNHRIRLLGRHGTMNVDLVASPLEYASSISDLNSLISGFSYVEGNRYSDFRAGDKVAKYGLAALIAGGTGAVLLKTGLLAKFWKLIVVAIVSLAGFIKKLFRSIFGGNETKVEDPNQPTASQG
jgi:uncharacterized membrane-anchored protein